MTSTRGELESGPKAAHGQHRAGFVGALTGGVFAAAALAFACGSKPPPPPVVPEVALDAGPSEDVASPPPPPLYTRLGGKDGVAAIIDSFVDDMLADKRLKKSFSHVAKGPKLDHFKQMLADQICEITGGGCHYTGKNMADEHAGMRVTRAQFDAFISDFQLALEEKQVAKDDAQQLLDQLSLMKDDIVHTK